MTITLIISTNIITLMVEALEISKNWKASRWTMIDMVVVISAGPPLVMTFNMSNALNDQMKHRYVQV